MNTNETTSNTNDRYFSPEELATYLRDKYGRKTSTTTIWRWCRDGVGTDGAIKLRHIALGGRMLIGLKDVEEFFRARQGAGPTRRKRRSKRSDSDTQEFTSNKKPRKARDLENVRKRLDEEGL